MVRTQKIILWFIPTSILYLISKQAWISRSYHLRILQHLSCTSKLYYCQQVQWSSKKYKYGTFFIGMNYFWVLVNMFGLLLLHQTTINYQKYIISQQRIKLKAPQPEESSGIFLGVAVLSAFLFILFESPSLYSVLPSYPEISKNIESDFSTTHSPCC